MVIASSFCVDIILTSLKEQVFIKIEYDFILPQAISSNFDLPQIIKSFNGDFKYHTNKRSSGNYYTQINIRCKDEDSKHLRDKLVKILKDKNIDMIAGNRMKLSVRTRSLIYQHRHFLKAKVVVNKFNL